MAAHVRDKELQQRLLDLAEEYERKAAESPATGPDSHLGAARGRTDRAALSREQHAEEPEDETTEP